MERLILEQKLSSKSLSLLDELIQSLKTSEAETGNRGDSSPYSYIEAERVRFDLATEVLLFEASRARATRNSFSPVNKLPVELLSRILLIGALRDISNSMPLPLSSIAASHVCRRWRQISLSTPLLWTRFHPQLPAELASRAQGLPRDFLILSGSPWDRKDYESTMLNMHSLQIISPAVQNRGPLDLSSYMSFPAPNLTSLQLSGSAYHHKTGYHYTKIQLPSSPFQGQHGNLEGVIIFRCVLKWESSIFVGLRRLDIRGVPDCNGELYEDQLLSILTACPKLEELAVRDYDLAGAAYDLDGPPLTAVALPCLRSLAWDTLLRWAPYHHAWLRALQTILVPDTVELDVRCSTSAYCMDDMLGETRELSDIIAPAHGLYRPFQIILSRCRHLTFGYPDPRHSSYDGQDELPDSISIDAWGNNLALLSRPTDFNEEPTYASSLMLDSIPHLCRNSHIQSLRLCRADLLDFAAFIQVMRALPGLVKIILFEIAPECEDEIFNALADGEWTHHIGEIVLYHSTNSLLPLARSVESCVERTGKACVRRVTLQGCNRADEKAMATLEPLVEVLRVEGEISGRQERGTFLW
ncbi:hypothetical protein BOTBODRAFT_171912 [Botryobasidium botryosum FD-172 SS1]|uniref:F-box domain-containing protein n=1 Tax=Botryobasidium botryosum (strain FD-172 SS1) TaxID=930990 RepID=A0A067MU81_BOTB1|nr:hypothetical protein BOTBODRAFT_171912 [Botryobasidium botryosum FD-172 SS1]